MYGSDLLHSCYIQTHARIPDFFCGPLSTLIKEYVCTLSQMHSSMDTITMPLELDGDAQNPDSSFSSYNTYSDPASMQGGIVLEYLLNSIQSIAHSLMVLGCTCGWDILLLHIHATMEPIPNGNLFCNAKPTHCSKIYLASGQ